MNELMSDTSLSSRGLSRPPRPPPRPLHGAGQSAPLETPGPGFPTGGNISHLTSGTLAPLDLSMSAASALLMDSVAIGYELFIALCALVPCLPSRTIHSTISLPTTCLSGYPLTVPETPN